MLVATFCTPRQGGMLTATFDTRGQRLSPCRWLVMEELSAVRYNGGFGMAGKVGSALIVLRCMRSLGWPGRL
eukprot:784418-Pelagomonas_calceolata.AAC.1